MIPKLSAPLTKFIRTSEGILVWSFNVALVIGASIPSAHLSVKDAAILAAANNVIAVISRTALKTHAASVLGSAGLAPTIPNVLGTLKPTAVGGAVATGVGDVAQDLAQTPTLATVGDQVSTLVTDAEEIASPPPPDPAPADAPAAS